jgi:protein-L-isoaspartate(D-aspartate) O-methyltransferase
MRRRTPGARSRICRSAACLFAAVLSLACRVWAQQEDPFREARSRMVREQIEARGVEDPRVLEAMAQVPRHEFVPEAWRARAYDDEPLPIGAGQTISQPYVVAAMSEALELQGSERVLEIGTGSGYQTAVLARLAREVFSIEIVEPLATAAKARLARLEVPRVHVRHGDGYQGWPEHAPFDAILVTAAPEQVPEALVEQLAVGGRMVLPLGPPDRQRLVRLVREAEGIRRETLFDVRFVPMVHPPPE